MNHVATLKDKFMENFYLKGIRSVAKARAEGPAAYVFPADESRPAQATRLLRLLQMQGVEVHRADKPFKVKEAEFAAGSYVVRMDQPYSRMADMMIDRQYFNVNDPRPYDDVGWTLGPLHNVRTVPVASPGGLVRLGKGAAQAYLIAHNAENPLATFRFARRDLKVHIARKDFDLQGRKFRAGTFVLKPAENPSGLEALLDEAGQAHGFAVYAAPSAPGVPVHESVVPRVAVMHTWQTTQTEGWLRIALDEYGIPYDYVSVHEARDKYVVIVFGPSTPDPLSLVNGLSGARTSPLVYGYDDTLGVYFSQSPVFAMGGAGGRAMGRIPSMAAPTGRPSGRGSASDPDVPQGRARDLGQQTIEEFRKVQKDASAAQPPAEEGFRQVQAPAVRLRTVLSFARNANDLLISGGLANGDYYELQFVCNGQDVIDKCVMTVQGMVIEGCKIKKQTVPS